MVFTATLIDLGIAFLLAGLISVPSAFAVTYTNDTTSRLVSSQAACYGTDTRDVVDYAFLNWNDTDCTGIVNSTGQLANCVRQIHVENPDGTNNRITIEADPTPLGLPCPAGSAPASNLVAVSITDNNNATQTQVFDMNDCWGWWCGSNTGYNKTVCPFDFVWLQGVGMCKSYNASFIQAKADCPAYTFALGSNVRYANISWNWQGNGTQTPFELGVIGLSTSGRVKAVSSEIDLLTKFTPTNNVLVGDVGTLMTMNANLLVIVYYIAEAAIIIIAFIGLPTALLLAFKWVFKEMTGKELGVTR
jgi:hypothetical protein